MTTATRGRALFAAFLLAVAAAPAAVADALVFHATEAGRQTLDQGEGGGNPFAGALVEIVARPVLDLATLTRDLQHLTQAKSRNFQLPDVPVATVLPAWTVRPMTVGERRLALVMVVSDYAASGGAPSLPGAKHDAERVAVALRAAGFATEMAVDGDLQAMRRTLDGFRARSREADAAVIYTTGHGVEAGGGIYLIPGDYPVASGNRALGVKALPLAEIARAPAARRVNLVFYGGCRDDPMAEP